MLKFKPFYKLSILTAVLVSLPIIGQAQTPIFGGSPIKIGGIVYLAPTADSEVLIPEFRATLLDNEMIEFSGVATPQDGDRYGYRYAVDVVKGTYKTTYLTEEEIAESLKENPGAETWSTNTSNRRTNVQRIRAPSNETFVSSDSSALCNWSNLTYVVLTEDPPGIDLAKTTINANWVGDGSIATLLFASGSFWANPQTVLFTTWYVISTAWSQLTQFETGDPVVAWALGTYANWDWLDDDQATLSSHSLTINMQKDGSYTAPFSTFHWGESSGFLSGRLVTTGTQGTC